MKHFGLSVFKK